MRESGVVRIHKVVKLAGIQAKELSHAFSLKSPRKLHREGIGARERFQSHLELLKICFSQLQISIDNEKTGMNKLSSPLIVFVGWEIASERTTWNVSQSSLIEYSLVIRINSPLCVTSPTYILNSSGTSIHTLTNLPLILPPFQSISFWARSAFCGYCFICLGNQYKDLEIISVV